MSDGTPLAAIVTTDLSGVTRGRFMPVDHLEGAATGVGWLPANLALTPFGTITADHPWGSKGDLRLVGDPGARFRTDATGAATPFDVTMGDIVELDGQPWACCPRGLLRQAIDALLRETGLTLRVGFEHEFALLGGTLPPAHPLSVAALRRADPFAPRLAAALEEAGVEPEILIAEFGRDQFEVTHLPTDPLAAADRAIAIREITREVARGLGWQASFSPKTAPDAVGSGVHIHLSLSRDGAPVTHDPNGPGGLSSVAASFFAGVLRQTPAITALAAPSPISYQRLKPHSWSASWTWIADRDREATLRICPVTTMGGRDPAKQYNVEFRAADATANPYLTLAALVQAGLAGVRENLSPPPIVEEHPESLDDDARTRLGLKRLPASTEQTCAALTADPHLADWLPPALLRTFIGIRTAELDRVAGMTPDAICALYSELY